MPHTNQLLPLTFAILIGVAMVGVTAWQGYSFWASEADRRDQISSQALAQDTPVTRQAPQLELSSVELFGSATKTGEEAPVSTENLPETNLRLFLRGVLAADGEFPGSALIEDQERTTEAYLVGDELPGNARLRAVYPNRIIIERSGKLENLFFPETDNNAGVSVAANSQQDSRSAVEAEPEASSSPSVPATDTAQEQRRAEIRQRLEQLRERLRNNN